MSIPKISAEDSICIFQNLKKIHQKRAWYESNFHFFFIPFSLFFFFNCISLFNTNCCDTIWFYTICNLQLHFMLVNLIILQSKMLLTFRNEEHKVKLNNIKNNMKNVYNKCSLQISMLPKVQVQLFTFLCMDFSWLVFSKIS